MGVRKVSGSCSRGTQRSKKMIWGYASTKRLRTSEIEDSVASNKMLWLKIFMLIWSIGIQWSWIWTARNPVKLHPMNFASNVFRLCCKCGSALAFSLEEQANPIVRPRFWRDAKICSNFCSKKLLFEYLFEKTCVRISVRNWR